MSWVGTLPSDESPESTTDDSGTEALYLDEDDLSDFGVVEVTDPGVFLAATGSSDQRPLGI